MISYACIYEIISREGYKVVLRENLEHFAGFDFSVPRGRAFLFAIDRES
jgi:hypothetical protein